MYCGHIDDMYFEKDQAMHGRGGGYRHDWETVAVWTKADNITRVSVNCHGSMTTRVRADLSMQDNHMKIVYHKDGGQGILYWICSDLNCDKDAIETIYKKRWKVEVYHKTMNLNANLAKSPTRRVRIQANHVFLTIYSTFKLECLSIRKN